MNRIVFIILLLMTQPTLSKGMEVDWGGIFNKYLNCRYEADKEFIHRCTDKYGSNTRAIGSIFWDIEWISGTKINVEINNFRNSKDPLGGLLFVDLLFGDTIKTINTRRVQDYGSIVDAEMEILYSDKNKIKTRKIVVTFLFENNDWKINEICLAERVSKCNSDDLIKFKYSWVKKNQ